jgi:hypothetical protein
VVSMRVHSIDFDTWCKNHSHDLEPPPSGSNQSDSKWCRELYPWEVFPRIDYSSTMLKIPQNISIGEAEYTATITDRFVGKNGRSNFKIRLVSAPPSRRSTWEYGQWNEVFQLVVDPSGYIRTLFCNNKEPGKRLLNRFFNGEFEQIENIRSLPISRFFFRSLISYIAHGQYPGLSRLSEVEICERVNNTQTFPTHHRRFAPLLSCDRALWICYSFYEEKAHRLAIRLQGEPINLE